MRHISDTNLEMKKFSALLVLERPISNFISDGPLQQEETQSATFNHTFCNIKYLLASDFPILRESNSRRNKGMQHQIRIFHFSSKKYNFAKSVVETSENILCNMKK
jgi:hypothetical protein